MPAPLDPARLRQEILAWMSPPAGDRAGRIAGRQIRRLVEALEHPGARDEAFLSAIAEAELARRLLQAGCRIEFEIPTAQGRHADFRVQAEGETFFLHVKRLVDSGAPSDAPLPPALRALEALERPVAVALRAAEELSTDDLARLSQELAPFIQEASVGEEIVVRAEDGRWIGAARISAPVAGNHAVMRSGPDPEWDGVVPRVQHLLRKAYTQFMPGASNVICIASDDGSGAETVEHALLGSIVERWDRFPPLGHRVAHGRANDGFWAGGNFQQSALVAWYPVVQGAEGRLWVRSTPTHNGRDDAALALLHRALGVTKPVHPHDASSPASGTQSASESEGSSPTA